MVAYRENVALKRGNNRYIVKIIKGRKAYKDFLPTPDDKHMTFKKPLLTN